MYGHLLRIIVHYIAILAITLHNAVISYPWFFLFDGILFYPSRFIILYCIIVAQFIICLWISVMYTTEVVRKIKQVMEIPCTNKGRFHAFWQLCLFSSELNMDTLLLFDIFRNCPLKYTPFAFLYNILCFVLQLFHPFLHLYPNVSKYPKAIL